MAEYYRTEISSIHQGRERKRSSLGRLCDALALAFSVLVGLMMALTYLSPLIRPSGWFFPILGLIAPFTYVLTLCLMLYWVIRWRWWRVMPLALLIIIGLFHLSLFLRPEFRRHYDENKPRTRGTVKVLTFNVRQFYGPDGESSRDSLMTWLQKEAPDIICLQEFNPNTGGGSRKLVDSLLGDRYYATTGDTVTSSVIYTRYRILRSGRTRKDIRAIRSIWADLLVGSDTLRVYNNHLNSTAITSADDDFLSRENFLQDTAREEKVRSIVRRFRDNSIARAAQADTILRAMASSPYRRIVCGDFNDTPMSYVYHEMCEGLQDAFRKAGRGYSYTFRGFDNCLRIDYVLLDPSLEILSYEVPPVDFSDHYPVVVRFRP